MNVTKEEYKALVSERSPKSKTLAQCVKAFAVGGVICCVGQGIHDLYTLALHMETTAADSWTSITLIGLAAILTGLGVYDRIGSFAGAGSVVPITGFANSVVAPAMEFKSEGLILGTSAKLFTIAGPVLVYGIGASVLCGLVYWLIGLMMH
ncbi:MAG: stage V sporulation protein AC [Clostridia bacterium]|nr:stage V sporulation protein AC [Clostridia bacterium]